MTEAVHLVFRLQLFLQQDSAYSGPAGTEICRSALYTCNWEDLTSQRPNISGGRFSATWLSLTSFLLSQLLPHLIKTPLFLG